MMEEDENKKLPQDEDAELRKVFPFFKSWNGLYAFVLGELVVLILLFYLFSWYFS